MWGVTSSSCLPLNGDIAARFTGFGKSATGLHSDAKGLKSNM